MQRYELRPIGEGRLDLHAFDHLRDTFHDIVTDQVLALHRHEFGDGAAVAGSLHESAGDNRDGFGVVEFESAPVAIPGDHRGERHKKLVDIPVGQSHMAPADIACG